VRCFYYTEVIRIDAPRSLFFAYVVQGLARIRYPRSGLRECEDIEQGFTVRF